MRSAGHWLQVGTTRADAWWPRQAHRVAEGRRSAGPKPRAPDALKVSSECGPPAASSAAVRRGYAAAAGPAGGQQASSTTTALHPSRDGLGGREARRPLMPRPVRAAGSCGAEVD